MKNLAGIAKLDIYKFGKAVSIATIKLGDSQHLSSHFQQFAIVYTANS